MTPTAPMTDAQLRDRWLALERGTADLRRAIDRRLRAQLGLPGSWADVLIALATTPDNRQSTHVIARQTHLTSGGFTKLADRLVQARLITRDHSTDDRRIVNLSLTPLGVEKAAAALSIQTAVLRHEFDSDNPSYA